MIETRSGKHKFIHYFKPHEGMVCPSFPVLSHANGCYYGCSYCLIPDTRILTADLQWKTIGDIQVLERLVAFDEKYRRLKNSHKQQSLKPSFVIAKAIRKTETLRIFTDDGEVTCSLEHPWLTIGPYGSARRWCRAEKLRVGYRLIRTPVYRIPTFNHEYKRGYIAGLFAGDGTLRTIGDKGYQIRLRQYLGELVGLQQPIREFFGGTTFNSNKQMFKLETRSAEHISLIHDICKTDIKTSEFIKGFLAGFFDAEGQFCPFQQTLRVFNHDEALLSKVCDYARNLGNYKLVRETGRYSAILHGTVHEKMRFLGEIQNAIQRKREGFWGNANLGTQSLIKAIEPAGIHEVISLETSSSTFYANGFASHNCYLNYTLRMQKNKIVVWNNYPEMALQIARWCQEAPKGELLNAGELSDSFIGQNADSYSAKMLTCALRCLDKSHGLLMLTKSAATLLDWFKPDPRVVVAFSVNAYSVSAKYETGVPPSELRLIRAKELKEKGWCVRIRLDPMIPVDDGITYYRKVAKDIRELAPERVTLGTLRWQPQLPYYCSPSDLWTKFRAQREVGGKMRIDGATSMVLYATAMSELKGIPVDICKESQSMRQSLGLPEKPVCNCQP